MKELRVAIHQPNFIPWLGYFHKMSMVDVFVLFDDVQVPVGKSFASRALVKTNHDALWITVPTLNKSDKIDFRNIQILQSNWKAKAIKTIKLAYQKAPYFNDYFETFSEAFLAPSETLFELNYKLLVFMKDSFRLKAEFVLSSALPGGKDFTGAEKILAILEDLLATTYVSGRGSGSRRYINESDLTSRNVKLIWQEFNSPVYPQLHGDFVPNLSAIDYLFNCGPGLFSVGQIHH